VWTNNQSSSKARRILGNVLIFFGGLVLVGSAAAKFAHVPKVVTELGAMGFDGNKLMLIAILEILSAGLFLVRPLRAAGLLMVSAYLGGAIATHVQHGQLPHQPAFILALLWLGAWLRHPGVLWSLPESTFDTKQVASSAPLKSVQGRVWHES
jgi:hypothetical protein